MNAEQPKRPTPEMLPCPFCGGTPWISVDDHGRARWVSCDVCECDGPSWLGWMDDAADVTRQVLIAAWNQRQPTPRTLTPEQVERARTLLNIGTEQSWSLRCRAAFNLLREVVGDE